MLEDGTDKKRLILNTVRDTVLNLLDYDRKADEQLPQGAIEKAIEDCEVTKDEIVEAFKLELYRSLPE